MPRLEIGLRGLEPGGCPCASMPKGKNLSLSLCRWLDAAGAGALLLSEGVCCPPCREGAGLSWLCSFSG